jgi:hypothetical protein
MKLQTRNFTSAIVTQTVHNTVILTVNVMRSIQNIEVLEQNIYTPSFFYVYGCYKAYYKYLL